MIINRDRGVKPTTNPKSPTTQNLKLQRVLANLKRPQNKRLKHANLTSEIGTNG